MKKVIMFLLLAVIAVGVMSCGKDTDSIEYTPYVQKPITDYQGVYENTDDGNFFITIHYDGIVTMYINKYHLYRGMGELRHDTILVKDEFENKLLTIKTGGIAENGFFIREIRFGNNSYSNPVNVRYNKSQDKPKYSFKGLTYKSSTMVGMPRDNYIFYSDDIVNKQRLSSNDKLIREELYYYISRQIGDKYYSYLLKCNADMSDLTPVDIIEVRYK